MSIRFYEEAREEYMATIDLITNKEYVDFDDKTKLIAYAKALWMVVEHLSPPEEEQKKDNTSEQIKRNEK